jgi:hypothetical protein
LIIVSACLSPSSSYCFYVQLDPSASATASQANKEEVDSRSVFVGNVRPLFLIIWFTFKELFLVSNTCSVDYLAGGLCCLCCINDFSTWGQNQSSTCLTFVVWFAVKIKQMKLLKPHLHIDGIGAFWDSICTIGIQ